MKIIWHFNWFEYFYTETKTERQICPYTEQNAYTLAMKGFRINLRIILQLHRVFFRYSCTSTLCVRCLKAILSECYWSLIKSGKKNCINEKRKSNEKSTFGIAEMNSLFLPQNTQCFRWNCLPKITKNTVDRPISFQWIHFKDKMNFYECTLECRYLNNSENKFKYFV